jgi:O-antigen ligase/polysaccharide polymerase Wzy-like membrane protein
MADVDSTVLAARVLFWVLLTCVLLAPLRWAILAWLVMGNLDTTGPRSSVLDAVGWMNASKGVLVPLYLWWRLRSKGTEGLPSLLTNFWLLFVLYTTVASLWSPFPLAAAKLVGNLVGTFLTFVVLQKAGRSGLLGVAEITVLIAATLGLGALQTFYYGGQAYGFDGVDRPTRFSSFVGVQQYAAFLVAFLVIALWHKKFTVKNRVWLLTGIGIALVMNGSRIWFVGAAAVLLVYLSFSFRKVVASITLAAIGVGFGILLVLNFNPSGTDLLTDPSSRITATLSALATGQDTPQNIGLANLNFRLAIYAKVVDELRESSVTDLLFGHGTSSGGTVVLRVFPQLYKTIGLDPNRSIHSEWLRVLYEWGIAGFALLITILSILIAELARRRSGGREGIGKVAVFSFLPAFLLAFSSENLIAGAGNAVTMSLALTVALSLSSEYGRPVREVPAN